jgi:hypothetical protein
MATKLKIYTVSNMAIIEAVDDVTFLPIDNAGVGASLPRGHYVIDDKGQKVVIRNETHTLQISEFWSNIITDLNVPLAAADPATQAERIAGLAYLRTVFSPVAGAGGGGGGDASAANQITQITLQQAQIERVSFLVTDDTSGNTLSAVVTYAENGTGLETTTYYDATGALVVPATTVTMVNPAGTASNPFERYVMVEQDETPTISYIQWQSPEGNFVIAKNDYSTPYESILRYYSSITPANLALDWANRAALVYTDYATASTNIV